MVKIYYTYDFQKPIGQIVSNQSNMAIVGINSSGSKKKYLATGVNQYIAILSMRTGQVVSYLQPPPNNYSRVTYLFASVGKIYAGYQNGMIVCFALNEEEQNQIKYEIQTILDVHQAAISFIQTSSIKNQEIGQSILVTGSINGSIIIFDMLSQQNQTIKSAHKGQIRQLQCFKAIIQGSIQSCILSISKDGYLKLWNMDNLLCLGVVGLDGQALSMNYDEQKSIIYVGMDSENINVIKIKTESEETIKNYCEKIATIKRNNHSKALQMIQDNNFVYLLNSDKAMEVYQKLSGNEIKRKLKRVLQRKKEKSKGQNIEEQQKIQAEQRNVYQLSLKNVIQKSILFKCYNFVIDNQNAYLNMGTNVFMMKLRNHTFELEQLTHSNGRTNQLQLDYPFIIQRSQQQCIAYKMSSLVTSNCPQKLFTISNSENLNIKWCSLFNQGFIMLVTEKTLEIHDLAKNEVVYQIQEKWQGCYARSNIAMIWRQNILQLYQVGYNKKQQITMKKTSQHRCEEKINQGIFLNNSFQKYFLNLQNSTIKINYTDTHKQFLSLYGHKLPITSFAVSSDDAYMVTGSIDKDIRIWDLQFGYCIKTIYAHKLPVSCVRFIQDTHYLITGGRDGFIKFWDMDTHQLISEMQGNQGEVKDIVISKNGQYILAGGVDGGFRIWKQSQEQVIAGDQQQKNKQKVLIEQYAMDKLRKQQKYNQQANHQESGQKIRYEDLKHGEQIIEALQNSQHPTAVVAMLKKISPGNLRSSLSFLHSRHNQKLENYMTLLIQKNYQVETCYRVIENMNRTSSTQNSQKLGQVLRSNWEGHLKNMRINKQMLRLLGKSLKQMKELI